MLCRKSCAWIIFIISIYGVAQCCVITNVGCISQDKSILSTFLFAGIDRINWGNFAVSIKSLVCECIKEGKAKGMKYVAIRSYGNCYGTKEQVDLTTYSHLKHRECVNGRFGNCNKKAGVCVGRSHYEYTYSVQSGALKVDGKFGPWSSWGPCNRLCGSGVQVRKRSCNNPAPQNGGKNCIGQVQKTRQCELRQCSFRHVCKDKEASLVCPLSKKLYIRAAFFGRASSWRCLRVRKNISPCKKWVGKTIRKHCSLKAKCNLRATTANYGTDCLSSKPYLRVAYTCL